MTTLAQILNSVPEFVRTREAFEENSTQWAHDLAMGFRITESDQRIRERMVLAFTLVDAIAPDDPEIRPFIEQIRRILPNETAYIDRGITSNVLRDLMIGGNNELESAAVAVLREPRTPQASVSAKMREAIVSSSDRNIHLALYAMKRAASPPTSVARFFGLLQAMRPDLGDALNSDVPSGRFYNGPEVSSSGPPRDLVAGGTRAPAPAPATGQAAPMPTAPSAQPSASTPSAPGSLDLDPIILPPAGPSASSATGLGVVDSIETAVEYAEAVAQLAVLLGVSLEQAGQVLMIVAAFMRVLIGRPLPPGGDPIATAIDPDMARLERLVNSVVDMRNGRASSYMLPADRVSGAGAIQRLTGRRGI